MPPPHRRKVEADVGYGGIDPDLDDHSRRGGVGSSEARKALRHARFSLRKPHRPWHTFHAAPPLAIRRLSGHFPHRFSSTLNPCLKARSLSTLTAPIDALIAGKKYIYVLLRSRRKTLSCPTITFTLDHIHTRHSYSLTVSSRGRTTSTMCTK